MSYPEQTGGYLGAMNHWAEALATEGGAGIRSLPRLSQRLEPSE